MKIITAYATKNDCYKANKKMTPKGIVVHSTGANNKKLSRYVDAPAQVGVNKYGNHWNRSGVSKCVHSFIGLDINGEVAVANILPYTTMPWGCGKGSKGSYNNSHIQFEVCEDSLTDKAYFDKAFATAIDYCVYLCKQYGLTEKDIVSHYEAHKLGYASNHGDCDSWLKKFGKDMNWFRAEVAKKLNEPKTATVTGTYLYKVQVGAYSKIENAEKQLAKVKAAGFTDAYITKVRK